MNTLADRNTTTIEPETISRVSDLNNNRQPPEASVGRVQLERRLRLQYAVTKVLAQSTSIGEAIPNLLQAICIISSWEFAELWQVDHDRSMLRRGGYWKSPRLADLQVEYLSRTFTFGLGSGLPGAVWTHGKSVWLSITKTQQSLPNLSEIAKMGMQTVLAFPIRTHGNIAGVVMLYSLDTRQQDYDLLETLDSLASQIGNFMKRREAEDALEQSERRFRSLIENSSDIISLSSPEGKILYTTPSTERILGYSYEEFVSKDQFQFIHPDDRERTRLQFVSLLQTPGKSIHVEYRVRHKDGTWRWLESVGTNLLAEPAVQSIVGNTRDITERKHAEETRARLAAIVESSDDAIVSKTPEGLVTSWNAGAERLFGYSAGEMIGQSILRIVPADRTEEEARILNMLRMGQRVEHFETVRVAKDGRMIDVSLTISPIRDPSGKIIGASKIARDITERKRVERQVRELNQELERLVEKRTEQLQAANRELEAFSYSVAHDLRAPLRAIDGFNRVLREQHGNMLDEDGKRLLNVIRKSTVEMGQLIDALLAFSRVSRQKLQLELNINMHALVNAIIEEVRGQQPGRSITFPVRRLPHVQGSAPMLRQVWVNLISNAVKFTRDSPEAQITIGAQTKKNEHTFYVQDNGLGFDMRHADKLFGVFQRLHTSEEFEGTGVGLALAQRIIYRHGGRIWAESEPGKGATFYFTLPKKGTLS